MALLWAWIMGNPDYLERSPFFPNPLVCARDMTQTFAYEFVERLPWNGVETWLKETWDWLYVSWYMDWGLVAWSIALAILMTVIRMILNFALFHRIPKWVNMDREGAQKLPESLWKCGVYTITWMWAIYLIATKDYFFDLKTHWNTWHPGEPVDMSLRWLYIVQIGFYIHCAYATVFLETIRQDFIVLMLHHGLTVSLLLYSFSVRYHKIGLLVLFLQDIGDIVLELAKTSYYFKDRGGQKHAVPEYFANFFFAIFTIQHIVFRLYWFPTKVIYSSMHVSVSVFPGGPFYLPFNVMLVALYAMQVYWFKFIVRLLIKILVYNESVRDERDYEEQDDSKKED
jgi:ceramide synthetase